MSPPLFTLTDDQRDLVAMVADFTADNVTPFAGEWDRNHHFPADVLRKILVSANIKVVR